MGRSNNYLLHWIENLQAHGKNSFSLKQVRENFTDISHEAISLNLTRLSGKKKIASVYKGFYVIISPEYSLQGMVPPILFIDSLMNHLKHPYYVGLLSAASLYGAAHQRPQEFFVISQLPAIRSVHKKGNKINFIGRLVIYEKFLERRKTPAGYVKVSSPELTALDLLQFERHIGGLNRAATVLDELSESIKAENFTRDLILSVPVVMVQRLGYILERILKKIDLAEILFQKISKEHPGLNRRPLKAGWPVKGYRTDPKWNLIINVEIETDL